MENFQDEYSLYWETRRFFENEEFDCWGLDEAISGYYDSSSPDGAPSSNNAKNIVSERNRRKKLNERLFALRAVVPKISKMDKASIIKDAIDYIEELHEQESRIQAEIEELESGSKQKQNNNSSDVEYMSSSLSIIKKKRAELIGEHERSTPIEVLELRVSEVGERTSIISITCSKKTDTMVKLCEVFESLKLKIITANITAFSGRLLKTVFVEADEMEKAQLKEKIERAIANLDIPQSPVLAFS